MVQLPDVRPQTARPTERSPRGHNPDAKSRGTRNTAVRLRHVECACDYDTLRGAHHVILTRCIGWQKHNRADHPISYLDTLVNTGSVSIEATLRRRRILFAGFVARMEDTTLPKCVMFGKIVGGQEKQWMECFLDNFRDFGIDADQWTTAAQDEGEWRRTAEQGADCFTAKWIDAEKTRLDYGVQWYARTWGEGPMRG